VLLAVSVCSAANDRSAFEAANKLYEQGQYAAAAAAYEGLAQSHRGCASLYFNLGNAWFKAGQNGRAIAAWRQAGRLAPRDPSLRFNLQFARKRVSGGFDPPAPDWWRRVLDQLTLNEWTLLAAAGLWIWFILLALGEVRAEWRRALRGYATLMGLVSVSLAGGLAAAIHSQEGMVEAVVISSTAVVRQGTFDESPSVYQLHDGMEVSVLDRYVRSEADQRQEWLEVRNAQNRRGWLKRDQVIVLN
jgi:tetratricopeptide (TPR) repeat protein